ncbi:MAG: serine hydrolase domain-containing protein [Cardiobacteriaceae bacterium]|nr:serine hydrolase domain-containing protein [Cardiobacteriaceae bacterium]
MVVFLISVIAAGAYLWINHHQQMRRAAYTLQKPFVDIRCSADAPPFLHELMQYTLDTQASLNNQLAWRAPDGAIHHCESGWEDGFRGKKLLTERSRLRYASVSKVFTSMLVLKLANQGKLHPDDKVVDILATPKPWKDARIGEITVAMLLEHTGGFDRLKSGTLMFSNGNKPWCPTDLLQFASARLDFDPDTQYQYSNLGYCLLGAIVEKTTGLTFREAAEQAFALEKQGIRFLDDDFLPDEIQYDFRHEEFYSEFYHDEFDFRDSLSAVGGMSGSALALIHSLQTTLHDAPFNLLSRRTTPCAINLLDGCYGYVFQPYQQGGHEYVLHGKSGHFPGVETDIFADDKGGMLAILRGATAPSYEHKNRLKEKIYQLMEAYYLEQGILQKKESIL